MPRNSAIATADRSPGALFEACARDEDDAITEFVRRYQPELASYARRHRAEDPEGAADLATFDTVRRLADMRRLEEPAGRAYLYRALKGRLIDERRSAVPRLSLDDHPVEPIEEGPEHAVLDRLGLAELLDLLTPAEREVVSHRFVAGYTSVETAERVGRSPDAVRRLQSNALARLRLALAVAVVIAIGAGYWLLTGSSTIRTTEPVDDPMETDLPAPDPITEDLTSVPMPAPRPADAAPGARATGRVGTAPTMIEATTTGAEAIEPTSVPTPTTLSSPTTASTTSPTTTPSTSNPTTTTPATTGSPPDTRASGRDRRDPPGRPFDDGNPDPNGRPWTDGGPGPKGHRG